MRSRRALRKGRGQATVELALQHAEVGAYFRNYLDHLQIGWSGRERRKDNLKVALSD